MKVCPTCGKQIHSSRFKRHPECSYINKKKTKQKDLKKATLNLSAECAENIDDELDFDLF